MIEHDDASYALHCLKARQKQYGGNTGNAVKLGQFKVVPGRCVNTPRCGFSTMEVDQHEYSTPPIRAASVLSRSGSGVYWKDRFPGESRRLLGMESKSIRLGIWSVSDAGMLYGCCPFVCSHSLDRTYTRRISSRSLVRESAVRQSAPFRSGDPSGECSTKPFTIGKSSPSDTLYSRSPIRRSQYLPLSRASSVPFVPSNQRVGSVSEVTRCQA